MPNIVNFTDRKNSESGFTFVELMISITVFIIFTGSIYGLLRIANIQKTTVGSQTEVMSNLRLSLNTLGRDAVNAGFRYKKAGNMPDNLTNVLMRTPSDTNSTQDLLTPIISGNNVNANDFLPNTEKTDVIAFAYRDINFNNGNPIRILNSAGLSGGGVTLTTEPNAAVNANGSATPFDLYMISNSGTRTAIGLATGRPGNSTLEFSTNAANDIIGVNAPYTGAADAKSKLVNCIDLMVGATDCMNYAIGVTAIRIFWVSYHVTSNGTLIRTTYGNNTGEPASKQIQTQALAYNVQNFQVRYLLRDGTSSDNPSLNGANQSALDNVVQVEVTMSAKIEAKENGTSIYKVVDLKSTFSTKNLNYE